MFYRAEAGAEPVRDWLIALTKEERKIIGTDIKTVEYGWPIGMPVCRSLRGGLYEVRSDLDRKIARVIFCIEGDEMILLHGFIKKARKTLQTDLDLARRRRQILTGR